MRRSRLILVIFSLFVVNFSYAQSLQQAAAFFQDQQYAEAYKIYVTLAQNGDAVAQYNLGLMFKNGLGQEQDNVQANFWFQQAAKQGLLQAYNQIQAGSVGSATGVHVKLEYGPEEWVKVQKPNYYTLQLASSTNKDLIHKYYTENNLQGKAGYYRNRRQGENWYALVYGSYPSVSAANDAVAELPTDLRKWSPWVRKLKDIQRLMNH